MSVTLSKEECTAILERASDLYFGKLWVDDYVNLQYQDDVKDLAADTIISVNSDSLEMTVSEDMANTLVRGDKIIFTDAFGQKNAKQIIDMDTDGNLQLTDTEMNQIVNSLVMSDMSAASAKDILAYYHLDEMDEINHSIMATSAETESFLPLEFVEENAHNPGFALSLQADGGELAVAMTDHSSGLTYTLPVHEGLENPER